MWALDEFYSFSCGLAIIKDQVTKQSKIKSTVHEPNSLNQNVKSYNSLQYLILKWIINKELIINNFEVLRIKQKRLLIIIWVLRPRKMKNNVKDNKLLY